METKWNIVYYVCINSSLHVCTCAHTHAQRPSLLWLVMCSCRPWMCYLISAKLPTDSTTFTVRHFQYPKFWDPPCLMHAFISYSYDNGVWSLLGRGEEVDPPWLHQFVFFHVCLFLCLFTRVGVHIVWLAASVLTQRITEAHLSATWLHRQNRPIENRQPFYLLCPVTIVSWQRSTNKQRNQCCTGLSMVFTPLVVVLVEMGGTKTKACNDGTLSSDPIH